MIRAGYSRAVVNEFRQDEAVSVLSLPNEQTIQIIDEAGTRASVTVDPKTGLPLRKESPSLGKQA